MQNKGQPGSIGPHSLQRGGCASKPPARHGTVHVPNAAICSQSHPTPSIRSQHLPRVQPAPGGGGGKASICAPVYPQQSDARWVLQPAAVQGRSRRSSHTALSHITANAGPAWARRAVSAFTSGLFSSTGCFFLWYSKAPELEAPPAGRMASV